jgi:hypothetical protein
MAMQYGRKRPEAERYPHCESGASILHQPRTPISRNPVRQISPNSYIILKRRLVPIGGVSVLDRADETA